MNSDYCAQCGKKVPEGKQICSSCQNKNLKATAPNEDVEQECLLRWAGHIKQKYPEIELLFHIPNGGKRFKKTAKALKRQGVKAGVPDLCLPVPKGGYHGLFIELKRKYEGTARESQKEWLLKLYEQGYAAHLCHGWEEAAAVIDKYLNLDGVEIEQEKGELK